MQRAKKEPKQSPKEEGLAVLTIKTYVSCSYYESEILMER